MEAHVEHSMGTQQDGLKDETLQGPIRRVWDVVISISSEGRNLPEGSGRWFVQSGTDLFRFDQNGAALAGSRVDPSHQAAQVWSADVGLD